MEAGQHSRELWGPEEPWICSGSLSGPLYPKLSTCIEGAQLTQLVQLVTAGRLFPCHNGRVDP